MTKFNTRRFFHSSALILVFSSLIVAQSGATRPRRTLPNQPTPTPASNEERMAPPRASTEPAASSASTAAPARSGGGVANTTRAFSLLQQKQNAAALAEARQVAAAEPNNAEAWKIAGFAQMNMRQYAGAVDDLRRAVELQRAAGEEDANTSDALAQAYVRTEKFDLALPLLVAATTRPAAKPSPGAPPASPDPLLFYYRGLAEYQTGKIPEAEKSFNAAVKADPKNALPLFYLGRIAYDRNELDAAIAALNRATVSDNALVSAWGLLATSYLRRAAAATVPAKADADYLNAARAGEALLRVANDEPAASLLAQALIGAKQYARAATTLESYAAKPDVPAPTLYLLGIAYSRIKNFPKAVAALERAREKTPEDVNIYRELGYAYEVSKQYAKALAAYEKGAALAPADADFKESVERVRPVVK